MTIQTVPISALTFAEYNPRQIDTTDFENLKKSLAKFGFVEPVVFLS